MAKKPQNYSGIPAGWEAVPDAAPVAAPAPAQTAAAAPPPQGAALPEGFEHVQEPSEGLTVDIEGGRLPRKGEPEAQAYLDKGYTFDDKGELKEPQVDAGTAAWDGIKSSALMGADDEISGAGGAVGSVLGNALHGNFDIINNASKGYNAERDAARNEKERGWRQQPTAFGTGYAVGIIPSLALPGGRVAATLESAPARILAGAGVGGGYGAISGAANADGDINSRLEGGALGGLTGAAVGAAAPPILNAAGQIVGRVGEQLGVNALTQRGMSGLDSLIRRAPQDANRLSDLLATRRGQGFADTPLVDLLDQPGLATVRAAASKNGPGRDAAVDFADQRAADVQGDTARIARHLSPVSRPTADTISDIETRRTALADDQYDSIRNNVVPVTPELQKVLDTGAGRSALKDAIETSDSPDEVAGFLRSIVKGNEPSEIDRAMSLLPDGISDAAKVSVRKQLMAQGLKEGETPPDFTLDMLDRVKRNLQARSRSPDASGRSRQYQNMVNTLVNHGDAAVPGYAAARGNFAAASGLVDAAETGTGALRGGNPDEAIAASRALSDERLPIAAAPSAPRGKLELVDTPVRSGEDGRLADGGGQALTYTADDGTVVKARLITQPGSKEGYIQMAGPGPGQDPANQLGAAAIRDITTQLRAQRPDLDTITGFHSTGARQQVGATGGGDATASLTPRMVSAPSARSIARQSARRQFENQAGQGTRGALELANDTARGDNFLNRTSALVGDDTANTMRTEAQSVRDRYGRGQFISPNSGSQASQRAQDAIGGLIDFGVNAIGGGKLGVVRAVARHLNNAGITGRDSERLVNMALDPSRVDDAIAYLARKTSNANAIRIVRSIAATRLGSAESGSGQAPYEKSLPRIYQDDSAN